MLTAWWVISCDCAQLWKEILKDDILLKETNILLVLKVQVTPVNAISRQCGAFTCVKVLEHIMF